MPKLSDRQKRILAKIHASQFIRDVSPLDFLASSLETDKKNLLAEIEVLERSKLVKTNVNGPALTALGRSKIVVVMTGGSFDIIHPGHLDTLEQAKSLGDSLIVSVARDATFRKNKKREPRHNEALRRKLVGSLKVVDAAVLGSEHEILETAILLRPDIIALGYDQSHDGQLIRVALLKRGIKVKIVRLKSLMPEIKTYSILSEEKRKLSGTT